MKYTYYKTGHVSNITIKDESDPTHRYDLALYYARNGVLWLAAWGEYDIIEEEVENYQVTGAREFRYDNPRQRYMVRDLVTPTPNPEHATTPWYPASSWTYTDYAGVTPYADSTVVDNSGTAAFTQLSRYQGGAGILARQTIDQGQVDTTTHLHGDLIRSTNLTTDDAGDGESAVAYTAFGEVLGASGPGSPAPAGFPRYQYAGGWGYEADLLVLEGHDTNLPPVTLQHLGARWYDPSIGRFVMRDPIGLAGGMNLYAYVTNSPLIAVDPPGLDSTIKRIGVGLGLAIAGLALDLYYSFVYVPTAEKAIEAHRPGWIGDCVRKDISANDPPRGTWHKVEGHSRRVAGILYFREDGRRITVVYVVDGETHVFETHESNAPNRGGR